MADIILESLLTILVGISFCFLLLKYRAKEAHSHDGWKFLLYGFALILFGTLLDVTDNFPNLNKYIIIGDTTYQSFLKKVIGYVFGFALLSIGFRKLLTGNPNPHFSPATKYHQNFAKTTSLPWY